MALITPADVTSNQNIAGKTNTTINLPAPKVIAPIALPGVMSRGTNEIPEEKPIEHVVEEDTTNEDEGNEERLNDDQEQEPEPVVKTKVKFLGKEFDSLEAAEAEAKRNIIAARGSQAKSQKSLAELQARLDKLEKVATVGTSNKPSVIEPDPEVAEFWNDVQKAQLALENIKDPKERARQNTIITASIVTRAVEQARTELLEELGKDLNPIKEERARTQKETEALNKAYDVFTALAKEVDDGSPIFPELGQESDFDEIAKAWEAYRNAGMPDKLLFNPDHIRMIIYAYRASKTGDPNIPVPEEKKPVIKQTGKKLPSLPPNLTKGNGKFPGMRIPGVLGRGKD